MLNPSILLYPKFRRIGASLPQLLNYTIIFCIIFKFLLFSHLSGFSYSVVCIISSFMSLPMKLF